jgi:hypothetical protein
MKQQMFEAWPTALRKGDERQIENIVVGQNFDKETVDWNNKQELDRLRSCR